MSSKCALARKAWVPNSPLRHLILVLGDQLDERSSAFDGFDPARDAVWMAEVAQESAKVWSSKPRIAMFLAAMRHFRDRLRSRGWVVHYRELPAMVGEEESETLGGQLQASVQQLQPQRLITVEAGEWGVAKELEAAARAVDLPLEIRADRHFLCTQAEFRAHAGARKQLRLEFFYRELRQRTGVLMRHGQPMGGQWNFDASNRGSFGKGGPGWVPPPVRFVPDQVTSGVLALVNQRFAGHPGRLESFDWPVTQEQAREALSDFIAHRLADFGTYQDAMWTDHAWLYHSRLSAAMNLKLLDPREVIAAAEHALDGGKAPLESVEGFIRQILGWREYVRGVYWLLMPEYLQRNALGADQELPPFYWTGKTEMNCLHHAIGQTLDHGYAHHIQRLMVTGLFSLLLGVRPQAVHEWYLAVYVDAVEWVELPNTLGMSQYADGGVMASKPYIASGKYIQRMSNYCSGCPYDPGQSTGPKACPFTTLYWDFLLQHEVMLKGNPRMAMQVRNLSRLAPEQRTAIQRQAAEVRERCRG